MLTRAFGHLEVLSLINATCLGSWSTHAAVSQILEDLPAAVHPANVAFRIMLVNPLVDCLGASMFNLNLGIGDFQSATVVYM